MAKKKTKLPPFEKALEELEAIVNEMEGQALPLETLLNHYEDGHELVTHCQSLIEDARQRIEIIHLNQLESQTQPENKLADRESSGDTQSSEAASDDTRLL